MLPVLLCLQPEIVDGVSSERELCELVAHMLVEKSPMLEEYLGMRIDKEVQLV
jgi:hypothetical protein